MPKKYKSIAALAVEAWKPTPGMPEEFECNRCHKIFQATPENFPINERCRWNISRMCHSCTRISVKKRMLLFRAIKAEFLENPDVILERQTFRLVSDPDEESGFPSGGIFDRKEIQDMLFQGWLTPGSVLQNGKNLFRVVQKPDHSSRQILRLETSYPIRLSS